MMRTVKASSLKFYVISDFPLSLDFYLFPAFFFVKKSPFILLLNLDNKFSSRDILISIIHPIFQSIFFLVSHP